MGIWCGQPRHRRPRPRLRRHAHDGADIAAIDAALSGSRRDAERIGLAPRYGRCPEISSFHAQSIADSKHHGLLSSSSESKSRVLDIDQRLLMGGDRPALSALPHPASSGVFPVVVSAATGGGRLARHFFSHPFELWHRGSTSTQVERTKDRCRRALVGRRLRLGHSRWGLDAGVRPATDRCALIAKRDDALVEAKTSSLGNQIWLSRNSSSLSD